jgi:hypothetical protein
MEFVILAVLGSASWSSGVPHWQLLLILGYGFQVTACSLQRAINKPFNLAIFCSLASEGVVQALTGVNASSEGVFEVSARSQVLLGTITWWIPLLFMLVLWCPSLDKLYKFISIDIPTAINESLSSGGASSFVQDINNNIMQQQDCDWTPDSDEYHPTSSSPPPVPSTLPPPSRALRPRIKQLLLTTLTILFIEPTNAYPSSSPTA